MRRFAFVFMLLVLGSISGSAVAEARFDDSAPDVFKLADSRYEIVFQKSNGAIVSLRDPLSAQPISVGSRNGCLWGAYGARASFVSGCGFSATGAERFTYGWDASAGVLTLTYSGTRANATVQVQAVAPDTFDMTLSLENRQSGALDFVLFPSELQFEESILREVLFPILPGVAVGKSFFDENRSFQARYPGSNGAFADFMAFSTTAGELAVYAVSDRVHPLESGLHHIASQELDRSYLVRAFGVDTKTGATWTSPRVRFRIGASWVEAAKAFRDDNAFGSFPSIRQKLGARYDAVVHAPFFKLDMQKLLIPFSEMGTLLEQLPVPSILHVAAYGPRFHDEDYPDYLPPNSALGTTDDFKSMVDDAHRRGMLVMPYTNPTIWDDESPTMRSLPAGLTAKDVAVIDASGNPVYEVYFGRGGYAISPHVPFVKERLARSFEQMSTELGSDMIFEDQIGARPWMHDSNASSPSRMAYIDGWLEHTRQYRDKLLGTEMGFDRLAETEFAFFGATPRVFTTGDLAPPDRFGWGNWAPWPLAPILLRDKVLFYQHNLDELVADKPTIRFNMAMGYQFNYAVFNPFVPVTQPGPDGGLDTDGFKIVTQLQARVCSRYASERLLDYVEIAPHVTRSSFETHTVITNWSDSDPYTIGNHVIAPGGWFLTSRDGRVTAGVFRQWNGVPLAAFPDYGDHFIIEERSSSQITLAKPAEVDSDVTVVPPRWWKPSHPITIRAHAMNGEVLGTMPYTFATDAIRFFYARVMNGQLVTHYTITNAATPPFTRRPAVRH